MQDTSRYAIVAALVAAFGAQAFAAGIWDGNGDPNNSGQWTDADNWDDNVVPHGNAVTATLGDVTSGHRVVTYSSATSLRSLDRLTITQDTADATNTLVLSNNNGVEFSLGASGASPGINLTGAAAHNIAISILNSNAIIFGGSAGVQTFTNPGTITLGDTSAQSSSGRIEYRDTSAPYGFTYVNNGTTTLNNGSTLRNAANPAPDFDVINNGTLNLAGHATGVSIWKTGGSTADSVPDVTLTNAAGATINVSRNATISTGVGLAVVGADKTGPGRHGVSVTNAGIVNIRENAELSIRSKRGDLNEGVALFDNDGGTLNIGDPASTTAAGTLSFAVHAVGAASNDALGMRLNNSGTINLYGASRIVTSEVSSSEVDGDRLQITNSGTINLRDISSIGDTSLSQTAFINSGTLNKTGSGIASILSHSSATSETNFAVNTGTIHIQDGALRFTAALDSSSATSEIRFNLGDASAVDAMLLANGLVLGADSGSRVTLEFSAPLTQDRSWNLWDTAFPATGQFTQVILTGSITGTFGGSPASWSAGSYMFTLDYSTGVLTAVVPEPAMLSALPLGGVALLRRRRQG